MATHPVYQRKLRMGMVGGGPGSFIGEVHRKAARLDGQIEIVAGAFSSNPDKSKAQGELLFLSPDRVYGDYLEMVEKEKSLPENERIDFVSIVVQNNLHFPIAKAFLEAGFNVVSDKPVTFTLAEALELKTIIEKSGQVYVVTYNYTGYPMVKLAKDMVKCGDLGAIRKIVVQYPQGWLSTLVEKDCPDNKQAAWRTDPARCGVAGCMGDIGTHAENMAEYITGLKMTEVCADLTIFVDGRKLDDDGNVLVHWENGCKGILFASQISIGHENDLAIWVYGEKAGLEWHQEQPNQLLVKKPDCPLEVWSRANGYVAAKSPMAAKATRIPAGHQEAFFEAFANVYLGAVEKIRANIAGVPVPADALDAPTIDNGIRGMAFIEAVVESSSKGAVWTKIKA